MMITIHGFPAKTKFQDVKMLIKQECNINDFILDNLISDTDGTKKVRIGLADNTEGYKVMKCLDGYRMPGNFILKAVPIGKAVMKGKPLCKNSIDLLLDLISKHKVVTSKLTNATSNKLKEEAWNEIAQEFTTLGGEIRRPDQLKLKWENLKKNARKRASLIQNNLMTGDRKFIPPDEVLERVASILNAGCIGLSVEIGGDDVDEATVAQVSSEAEVEFINYPQLPEQLLEIEQSSSMVLDSDGSEEAGGGEKAGGSEAKSTNTITPKKFRITPNKTINKRRKLSEEVQSAQRDKDLGLAAYFQAKTESSRPDDKKIELENKKFELLNKKLDLENKKIELENKKLELENKRLELENVKLEVEIRQLKQLR